MTVGLVLKDLKREADSLTSEIEKSLERGEYNRALIALGGKHACEKLMRDLKWKREFLERRDRGRAA